MLKGEGEAGIAAAAGRASRPASDLATVPGAVTAAGEGPPPGFVHSLDDLLPARDLLRHRRKYFLGALDPCASIEFSRGCPWDCSFCSAWTFYGRSYRLVSPERVIEDLRSIREPGVFIVDDVAFIHDRHGMDIGEAIARAGIQKRYYLETRGDVLLRNKEVFRFWKRLGLEYMFLGLEAIDEEGLRKYRKRVLARAQFRGARIRPLARHQGGDQPDRRPRLGPRALPACCASGAWNMPEIINISVNTPYPGTESWLTEAAPAADARLPAVRYPARGIADPPAARRILRELVTTQRAIYAKHLDWRDSYGTLAGIAARLLLRGQTNFVKSLFKLNSVYRTDLLLADHARPVVYEIPLPPPRSRRPSGRRPLALRPRTARPRRPRIDAATERFVDETRMGAAP